MVVLEIRVLGEEVDVESEHRGNFVHVDVVEFVEHVVLEIGLPLSMLTSVLKLEEIALGSGLRRTRRR